MSKTALSFGLCLLPVCSFTPVSCLGRTLSLGLYPDPRTEPSPQIHVLSLAQTLFLGQCTCPEVRILSLDSAPCPKVDPYPVPVSQKLVPRVVALPDPVREGSVGAGPGGPHVLVCGSDEGIHLLPKSLR